MNIFEEQKIQKNTIAQSLEKIKKSMEDLEILEKELSSKLENKISSIKETQRKLENTVDKLDNELILENIEYSKNQTLESIKEIQKNTENCINNILLNYEKIEGRTRDVNIFMLIASITTVLVTFCVFGIGLYLYKKEKDINDTNYSEIKRIQNQIDDIYYLSLSDNKLWYDQKNQKLYFEDNKFIEQKNKENKAKMKNKK